MKTIYALTILTMFTLLAMDHAIASNAGYEQLITISDELPLREFEPYTGRGAGRFLAQKNPKAPVTCDKYPRICHAKGSGGPDCCKKQCVDVSTDHLNCGMCGKKCKYSEACCEGHCVNLSYNGGHCGKCNQRCNKGSSCAYGLCSYA